MKTFFGSFRHWIAEYLDLIVIIIGGILLSVRVFFPPKYYLIKGQKMPYEEPWGQGVLVPSVDFEAALLQALGIAVISGVIFYVVRRLNTCNKELNDENKTDNNSETRNVSTQIKESNNICSLTSNVCDYYDSKNDCCLYGAEGVEAWKSQTCPIHDKNL